MKLALFHVFIYVRLLFKTTIMRVPDVLNLFVKKMHVFAVSIPSMNFLRKYLAIFVLIYKNFVLSMKYGKALQNMFD